MNNQHISIKVGDIVKANYGSVVFAFANTITGKSEHLNIPPYAIVTEVRAKEKPDTQNIQVKIIFDATSFADYKEEELEVICSTGLKNNTRKPTLRQVQKEYETSEVVMGEMLASVPADGLSVEEAFYLYLKAMNWAEGNIFFRKYDDERMEEIEIIPEV
ncbi:hypothetical protein [Dysgonomonas termitidis]|uniref:Uncharacterized protein n=1 Tax=Dysgonomonas termitidis TaxID=1516126 RepID=A0ABV9KT59_9BACT